jgi:hypothetical protein
MRLEQIEQALSGALVMRPPKFGPDVAPAVKISALEDYLLASAWQHAELEEALHWAAALVEHLRLAIERMTGFEVALPAGKRADRITDRDVLAAKRALDPATFEAGARAKALRESIARQIARFEYETGVISRAYTLISGG